MTWTSPNTVAEHLFASLLPEEYHPTHRLVAIHRQYLARLPGVAQMHSSFALRTVRQTTAIPV